jgi:hypothetical protein
MLYRVALSREFEAMTLIPSKYGTKIFLQPVSGPLYFKLVLTSMAALKGLSCGTEGKGDKYEEIRWHCSLEPEFLSVQTYGKILE